MRGGSGNDSLSGGDGNDRLFNGTGNDVLIGNAGIDRFEYYTGVAFNTTDVGVSTIGDFTSNTDKIVLDRSTFTALTSISSIGFSLPSEFAVVSSDAEATVSAAVIIYL